MAKSYTALKTYPSSSSNKIYTVSKDDDSGDLSCNCPGWTRRVAPDGSRDCKHLRMFRDTQGTVVNRAVERGVLSESRRTVYRENPAELAARVRREVRERREAAERNRDSETMPPFVVAAGGNPKVSYENGLLVCTCKKFVQYGNCEHVLKVMHANEKKQTPAPKAEPEPSAAPALKMRRGGRSL